MEWDLKTGEMGVSLFFHFSTLWTKFLNLDIPHYFVMFVVANK
jgi:hypothetical protein